MEYLMRGKATMKMFTKILIFVLIVTCVSSRPQEEKKQGIIKCPTTTSCTCNDFGEIEIQCPQFEPHVFVRIQPNNYVHFECENITNNEHDLIPEIKLVEARFLQITRCPLPHGKSVASYLKHIHIDRVRSFQFVSSGANQHIPIESQHFQLLGDIERFDLRGMENEIRELPPDMFKNMTKLTWVRIRVANIHLPVNLFEPLENLEFLELGHNKLQTLEAGFLRNQRKLQQLNLWGNALRNLNKDSFIGLDLVKELDLSANGMESLEPDLLFHLTNLTDINLSANNFASIPEGLFANNRKLKNFRLLENRVSIETLPNDFLANLTDLIHVFIKCDLKKLPENVFEGSHNIEHIKLDQNSIDDLPGLLFADQSALTKLDMSDNLISSLPDELFLGTTMLTELKLSRNRLSTISGNTLQPLSRLTHLYLNDNRIRTVSSKAFLGIQSVEFITLQNNQLTFKSENTAIIKDEQIDLLPVGSPFQTLQKLDTLNLANNSLTTLFEDFTLNSLRKLNLSHNHISVISYDELQSRPMNGPDDLTIDLTNNRIEEVNFPLSIDPKTTPSVTVLLNNNPIKCDCNILNFLKYLKNRTNTEVVNKIKITIGDLQCEKPENLKSALVSALDPMQLLCPLDSEETAMKRCPSDCECFVRLEDKHLLMNCSSDLKFEQLPVTTILNLKHAELKMENVHLTSLPSKASAGYKEITKLLLGGNNLTKITLENLPTNLRVLQINNNKLKTLDESVMNFISNSTNIEQLKLSGNPWECNCTSLAFMNFVQKNHKKISDFSEMNCSDGRSFDQLTPSDLCNDDNMFIVIISLATAFMGLVLGALAALYYKYQKQIKMWLYSHNMCLWFVTEEELDKDKRYDAFVSYSHRDQDFVADYLLPELENGTISYKLCVHERDWLPGLAITTQISNSVNDAKRTIIVMSPNYLQSNWAQWEFTVAQSHAATEKRSRIIVILYGDIGDINKLEPDIRDYLKLNTYVKWGDKWFWEKLKYAMPHVRSDERMEKTKGLVKTAIKSSVDDKLELIKPVSVTPPQLTTPPAEKVGNPLITSLNAKNAANQNGKVHNGYNNGHINGHINGAFVINTSSRQSDV